MEGGGRWVTSAGGRWVTSAGDRWVAGGAGMVPSPHITGTY